MPYRLCHRTWMGAVTTNRLTRFRANRRGAWVIPAAAGIAVTANLCWGAWVSAHAPKWVSVNHAWWREALRPDSNRTLLVALAACLLTLACYRWPRKRAPAVVGLTTVVAMVLVGGVLGTSALVRCRGGDPFGRRHQRRPLERLGPDLILADGEQGLEALTVAGAGHRHGMTAALVRGTPEPVRQVDLAITRHGTGRSGPVALALPGGGHG